MGGKYAKHHEFPSKENNNQRVNENENGHTLMNKNVIATCKTFIGEKVQKI